MKRPTRAPLAAVLAVIALAAAPGAALAAAGPESDRARAAR